MSKGSVKFYKTSDLFASARRVEFDLFVSGLKSKSVLIECPADTFCAYSGTPINQGALVVKSEFGKNFTNQWDVAGYRLPFTCLASAFAITVDSLRASTFGFLVTPTLFSKKTKVQEFADTILNPPADEPFSIAIGNAKNQHILWRAPVNFSDRVFTVQVGGNLLEVNRLHLIELHKRFTDRIQSLDIKSFAGGLIKTPYQIEGAETMKVKSGSVSTVSGSVKYFLRQNPDKASEIEDFIEECESLPFSTKWALSLLYSTPASVI
ncbi:MAG: hypothetical protein IBX55_12095 [Methyloprofundus sp.]|nr:hypothetical protein [Methyloprofundus sp.]